MRSDEPNPAGGFSLVEVMVVVVILGLLASAVAIRTSDMLDRARAGRARSDMAVILQALEAHYAEHGRYPDHEEGLSALPLRNLADPWNRPYVYNRPGRNGPFELICLGADGRAGGEGPDADLHDDEISTGDAGESPAMKGFTLVETLAAVTLLASVGTGLLLTGRDLLAIRRETAARSVVLDDAEAVLAGFFTAEQFPPDGRRAGRTGRGDRTRWTAELYELEPAVTGLRRLRVHFATDDLAVEVPVDLLLPAANAGGPSR